VVGAIVFSHRAGHRVLHADGPSQPGRGFIARMAETVVIADMLFTLNGGAAAAGERRRC